MKTIPISHSPGSASAERNSVLQVQVALPEEVARFDQLIGDLHYLGSSTPVGHFLRQVVVRNGEWIGLLAWGPACYSLRDRDEWIGWNPTQRAERLKLLVQNRRFLLLHERGKEPNLASQSLAAALNALPQQWEELFGYRPLLAETFTDIERFNGTCYKASGWTEVCETKGFSRDAIDFYIPHDRIKKLWLKPLEAKAVELLCSRKLPDRYAAGAASNAHGVLPFKSTQLRSLMEALQKVPDPRACNSRFRIGSVLGISAMALLCGFRQIAEIQRFASRLTQKQREKIGLPLKKGSRTFREIPTYYVFYRLLETIDLQAMADVLTQWLQQQTGTLPGALAMDGKFIRDTVGVLTLADHETGAPEAMAHCSKKKATANIVN